LTTSEALYAFSQNMILRGSIEIWLILRLNSDDDDNNNNNNNTHLKLIHMFTACVFLSSSLI
jgi:hypothetical protein